MLNENSKINKTKEEYKDNILKERTEKIANKFFINNGFFSEEEGKFLISYQKMFKAFKNVDVISNFELATCDFEIIVRKAAKSKFKFNFEEFLEIIILIVEKVRSKEFRENPKLAVHDYVSLKLENLEVNIQTVSGVSKESFNQQAIGNNNSVVKLKNNLTTELVHNKNTQTLRNNKDELNNYGVEEFQIFIENFRVETNQKKVMNHLSDSIFEVYSFFFHYELKNSTDSKKLKEEGLNSLIKFCKQMEIVPYFISLNSLNKYWIVFNDFEHTPIITGVKNIGTLFKLSDFCLTLIHLTQFFSIKKLSKKKQLTLNETDKLLLYLKFINDTKGFEQLKISKGSNKNVTFIPELDFLNRIGSTELFPKYSLIKSLSSLDFNSSRYLNLIKEKEGEDNNNKRPKLNRGNSLKSINSDESDEEKKFRKTASAPKINKLKSSSDLTNNNIIIRLNLEKNTLNTKYMIGNSTKTNLTIKDFMTLSYSVIEQIENHYLNGLKNIYLHYIRQGEKINNNNLMSFSNYLHLFQDVGVVEKKQLSGVYINKQLIFNKGLIEYHQKVNEKNDSRVFSNKILNNNDIQLIYSNLTGRKNHSTKKAASNSVNIDKSEILKLGEKNCQNKMGFKVFLKSLEIVSEKIFPKLSRDDAFLKLLDENLYFIITEILGKESYTELDPVTTAFEDLISNEISNLPKDFMEDLSKILLEIYKSYSDISGLISYDKFFLLFKNFDIYPKEISLIKLKDVFNSLNNEFLSSQEYLCSAEYKQAITKKQNSYLDFKHFVYSTCIFGLLMNGSKNNEEKIMYLIKKMSLSEGVNKSKLKALVP